MSPATRLPGSWVAVLGVTVLHLALAFVLYAQILHAPFVFDDAQMTGSPLTHATSFGDVVAILSAPVPRVLTRASFALNFYLGHLDPFGYHLVNVVAHALTGTVLFLVILTIVRRIPPTPSWRQRALPIALLASVAWLIHPVQTQAVAYVWQRSTILAALFYTSGAYCFLRGRESVGSSRWIWFASCALCGLAALESKENAAVFPLTLAALEILVVRRGQLEYNRPLLLGLLTSLGLFLILALDLLGPRAVEMMAADFERRGFTVWERLLTETRIVVHYLTLLAYPNPGRLILDYDFFLSSSPWSPPTTLLSLLLIAGLLAFALAVARRMPLLSLAILWFFGNLVIESSFVPLDLVYEHRVYLPSMVPLALVAGVVVAAPRRMRIGASVGLATCVVLGAWTVERAAVWRKPVTLFGDNAAKTPRNTRVLENLGNAYLAEHDYREARRAFARALAVDATSPPALNGQAVINLNRRERYAETRALLMRAIKRSPRYTPALVNLGLLELREGALERGVDWLERALELNPESRPALLNLATAQVAMGQIPTAIATLRSGLAVWPADPMFHAALGQAYLADGDAARARTHFQRVLQVDPENEEARRGLRSLETR